MRNLLAAILIIALHSMPLYAQSTWQADKSHTSMQFKVQHMIFSHVTGRFSEYEVTAVTPGDDSFDGAEVSVTIRAASINTDNERRDNHLRGDDFLNAEVYPEITFKSSAFQKTGEKSYKMIGNLTIRDVTKSVELDAELYGIGATRGGKRKIAGFHVSGTIDRFDFNVKFDRVMETGGLVVGRDIQFDMDIELILRQEE